MMTNNKLVFSLMIMVVCLFMVFGCNSDNSDDTPDTDLPELTTTQVTAISLTSALSGGNVTSEGGTGVTARGICWGINPTPSLVDSFTIVGSGSGSFVSEISNLTTNTSYYVRAYATNSNGTSYGEAIQFTTLQLGGNISLSTVDIPAGSFTMGSPSEELERGSNEPQFAVSLSAFKMSKYEITNAQFAEFLNANSIYSSGTYPKGAYPNQTLIYDCSGDSNWGLNWVIDTIANDSGWVPVLGYENHPVVYVTWYGAAEFANYAGGRLPTEAEWEYACRANTAEPFYTGWCLGNADANYFWDAPYSGCSNSASTFLGSTQEVGSYSANAFGLYDMHGNVWEWCGDWYDSYPTTMQTNPNGPSTGLYRVLRGGSWDSEAQFCRSADRNLDGPYANSSSIGFRVVIEP